LFRFFVPASPTKKSKLDAIRPTIRAGTENALRFYGGVQMANERMNDAPRSVPPDKAAKDTKNSQAGSPNKADAEKVKKDELMDDRFQATDN
jgi:hypothetical protein